jgi:hypothetical protein
MENFFLRRGRYSKRRGALTCIARSRFPDQPQCTLGSGSISNHAEKMRVLVRKGAHAQLIDQQAYQTIR